MGCSATRISLVGSQNQGRERRMREGDDDDDDNDDVCLASHKDN